MPKRKPQSSAKRNTPGPKADRLKLTGDWKRAVKAAEGKRLMYKAPLGGQQ